MQPAPRYNAVAITLHWMIAAALLVNLGLGLWMSWAIDAPSVQAQAVNAFQWHKSLGLAVLVLSLVRLAWRLLYPPPPLPGTMARWEHCVAAATHWLFYGLMIALPLSGWLYVSAQWRGDAPFNIPTLWFGLFEVPHLLGLSDASRAVRAQVASVAFNVHGAMALAMVILLLLHIGAALKHHLVQRDGVLLRMLPWLATERQPVQPRAHWGRPPLRNLAAAGATLLLAVLLIAYAATTRLVATEAAAPEGKAAMLQTLVAASGTSAPAWAVDASSSHIRFAGVHAGRAFNGHFGEWQAAIHLDPAAPEQSFIAAVVATASATDGVPLHDRSLPQGEWFDVANHPYATYHSTRIEALDDGRLAATGILTIKGHAVELGPLILNVDGGQLDLSGSLNLDRANVDMGMESDPRGEYVSREIGIRIEVSAGRD